MGRNNKQIPDTYSKGQRKKGIKFYTIWACFCDRIFKVEAEK